MTCYTKNLSISTRLVFPTILLVYLSGTLFVLGKYSVTFDKGPYGNETTFLHGTLFYSHSSSTLLTSEIRRSSQQLTKQLIPRYPLFRGSTVYLLKTHDKSADSSNSNCNHSGVHRQHKPILQVSRSNIFCWAWKPNRILHIFRYKS